jgi:hypothetical protein
MQHGNLSVKDLYDQPDQGQLTGRRLATPKNWRLEVEAANFSAKINNRSKTGTARSQAESYTHTRRVHSALQLTHNGDSS